MAKGRGGAGPPEDDKPAPRRGLRAGFQPTRRLETKAEAFVRLVNSRIPFFDNAVANIGKLSNTDVYEYSQRQVDQIFAYMRGSLDAIEQGFRGGRKGSTFRLDLDPHIDSQ